MFRDWIKGFTLNGVPAEFSDVLLVLQGRREAYKPYLRDVALFARAKKDDACCRLLLSDGTETDQVLLGLDRLQQLGEAEKQLLCAMLSAACGRQVRCREERRPNDPAHETLVFYTGD